VACSGTMVSSAFGENVTDTYLNTTGSHIFYSSLETVRDFRVFNFEFGYYYFEFSVHFEEKCPFIGVMFYMVLFRVIRCPLLIPSLLTFICYNFISIRISLEEMIS